MAVTTRKANVDVHPGRVLLDNQQTRCSKKQMDEDGIVARAAAHASKEKVTAKYQAVVKQIAQLEDEMALDEKDMQTHANRPDLWKEVIRSSSGSHVPSGSGSREGDNNSAPEEDDRHSNGASPEELEDNRQSNGDEYIGTQTGDSDSEGPNSAHGGVSDNGQLQFSDQERVTPASHLVKNKQVSSHFFNII